jgi:hypothetical protein
MGMNMPKDHSNMGMVFALRPQESGCGFALGPGESGYGLSYSPRNRTAGWDLRERNCPRESHKPRGCAMWGMDTPTEQWRQAVKMGCAARQVRRV